MKSTLTTMTLSLTTIAVAMGALLGFMHEATAKQVAESELQAKNEALSQVLPGFDNTPSETVQEITLPGDKKPVKVYTATKGGETVGTAVETFTADGFSGEITVMVGFTPDGKVFGYKVLQHAETPGLGAKADDWFRDTTGNRSIIGTDSELKVSKDGGTIDGITAATISSRAFLDAVNRGRRALAPNE